MIISPPDDRVARLQMDIHSPATTVHEALYFSARCRLMNISRQQLEEFVDQVCFPSADGADAALRLRPAPQIFMGTM